MRRELSGRYSERLGREMPVAAYGHAGPPVLMLPTAASDYLEYERFGLIDSVAPFVESGRVRLYTVNSINEQALLNEGASPAEKIEWLKRFDAYLVEEVLPLIRRECGEDALPLAFGISLGASLAANAFFRHPDLFGGAILMSGTYDLRPYFGGFYNEDVYFHNPVDYVAGLDDDVHLPLLRNGSRRIIIYSGQGAYEAPERARQLAEILSAKGADYWLDLWGYDVNHDWPWWRKAVPYYFGKALWIRR